jgi:AcrR family transcriptional regulator
MVRLSRAQQQERTRSTVLAAAREEFAERTYAEAKVDRIAERAELTRGAVYSNFPSKRALYLAVLLDAIEKPAPATRNRTSAPIPGPSSGGLGEVLGAVARVWLERLPLVGDSPARGNLQLRSLTGVIDDEPGRAALAQVTRMEALLLGLALESRVAGRMRPQRPRPRPARKVRLAAMVLTISPVSTSPTRGIRRTSRTSYRRKLSTRHGNRPRTWRISSRVTVSTSTATG